MKSSRKKSSQTFDRIRRDHTTELAEDYVEAISEILGRDGICKGVDLAKYFGVSSVTVTKTIARLQSEGLVDTKPYAPLSLTRKGQNLANVVKAKHEIVLKFLLALGISPETAEMDAEGIEHHVSPETLRAFQRFIEETGS